MNKTATGILNKFLNIITILGTVYFIIINLENVTYYLSFGSFGVTGYLYTGFQQLLQTVYGDEEGFMKCQEIRDYTILMITQGWIYFIFGLILIMMRLSYVVDKAVNNRANKVLKYYYIVCIVLMIFMSFVAAPFYISTINDM